MIINWVLIDMLTPSLLDVLQIENLLISNQGTIKLCDFGSATTVSHYPDYSWSAQKRSMVEDEVHTHTHTNPSVEVNVNRRLTSTLVFFLFTIMLR